MPSLSPSTVSYVLPSFIYLWFTVYKPMKLLNLLPLNRIPFIFIADCYSFQRIQFGSHQIPNM